MPRRCTASEWKQILQDVGAVTPIPRDYEVIVTRDYIDPPVVGYCEDVCTNSAKFKIVVSKDLDALHTSEVLIHEYAHLLDWRPYTPWTHNHGKTFWCHYQDIWRAYHQVL